MLSILFDSKFKYHKTRRTTLRFLSMLDNEKKTCRNSFQPTERSIDDPKLDRKN